LKQDSEGSENQVSTKWALSPGEKEKCQCSDRLFKTGTLRGELNRKKKKKALGGWTLCFLKIGLKRQRGGRGGGFLGTKQRERAGAPECLKGR